MNCNTRLEPQTNCNVKFYLYVARDEATEKGWWV